MAKGVASVLHRSCGNNEMRSNHRRPYPPSLSPHSRSAFCPGPSRRNPGTTSICSSGLWRQAAVCFVTAPQECTLALISSASLASSSLALITQKIRSTADSSNKLSHAADYKVQFVLLVFSHITMIMISLWLFQPPSCS